jgi:hypothetical protein
MHPHGMQGWDADLFLPRDAFLSGMQATVGFSMLFLTIIDKFFIGTQKKNEPTCEEAE